MKGNCRVAWGVANLVSGKHDVEIRLWSVLKCAWMWPKVQGAGGRGQLPRHDPRVKRDQSHVQGEIDMEPHG